MKNKITESTAFTPLGHPVQAKLFRVASGEYAGRRAALIATAPDTITLYRCDTAAAGWISSVTAAADVNDRTFDAVMMPNGDIHLVYSEVSTGFLVSRKLTFENGGWSGGDKVTVYSGAQCYDPSMAADLSGRLWVAWAAYVSPNRILFVKSSTDGGVTWGTGPADAGDQLQGGTMFTGVKVITDIARVHAIFYDQDVGVSIRSRQLPDGEWSAPQLIATGSGFSTEFDAAVAPNGHLGLVYDLGGLQYCEYDGIGWSAPVSISALSGISPQLRFVGNVPIITFVRSLGTLARSVWYTDRRRGAFSDPLPFDRTSDLFNSVLLYNESSSTFEDRTQEAAETTTGDLFHSQSGSLLQAMGDAVFLGMDTRFRLAHFRLSAAGEGGTLRYAYWDGLVWQSFLPERGVTDLSSADSTITFWTDLEAVPAGWQKVTVDGRSRFWIRIDVQVPFNSAPVGDQVTAATDVSAISLRR